MVEFSGLKAKLYRIYLGRWAAQALYLHGNPAYFTIYKIMDLYKNY